MLRNVLRSAKRHLLEQFLADSTPRCRTLTSRVGCFAERLEDRALLAAFIVNTTLDTVDANPGDGIAADVDGNTSLRAAIIEANALGGSHTIELGEGVHSLSIDSEPAEGSDFGRNLNIFAGTHVSVTGAGADQTTIDAGGLFQIFYVVMGASLDVRDVTFPGSILNRAVGGPGIGH